MPMPWKIYSFSPIDSDWSVVPTVGEFISQQIFVMSRPSDDDAGSLEEVISTLELHYPIYELERIIETLKRVLRASGRLEERLRIAPRILWFPGDTEFVFGFVWKLDSNGETFVAVPSPYRLSVARRVFSSR